MGARMTYRHVGVRVIGLTLRPIGGATGWKGFVQHESRCCIRMGGVRDYAMPLDSL